MRSDLWPHSMVMHAHRDIAPPPGARTHERLVSSDLFYMELHAWNLMTGWLAGRDLDYEDVY
eukprot:COSAG01_NODE_15416_length_1340_cov_0.636583_2_plen_62_part_00